MILRLALRLGLLGLCYLVAAALQLNHFIYTFLKGNYFFYQAVFYSSLLLFSLLLAPPYRTLARKTLILSLSPVVGYLSGLNAFFLMPLGHGVGLQRILTTKDLSSTFFASPLLTFGWFIGFYFFLVLIILDKPY